ncbi:MAG: hypothetical protein ACHQF2_06675 [Flavobacteriales bacterium]
MRLLALFILLGSGMNLAAQTKPQKQKVYSFVKVRHTLEWYQEQLTLWEEEIKTNPKNADAWLNAYTAARMVKLSGGKKTNEDLKAIVDKAAIQIPGTFEYNYIVYYNAGIKNNSETNLQEAYRLGPDRPELFDDFITMYEVNRDKVHLKEFCDKTFSANEISEGLYNWNYNMLNSCDENGIILTVGDNDTYPALVLQHSQGIRKDVLVLNASLMCFIDEYCDKICIEIGIPEITFNEADDQKKRIQLLCVHIQKNSTRPFYYAATAPEELYANVKDNVYTVGNAYKYSKERFDNIAVLKRNVDQKFLKDYIKVTLQNDISQSVVNDINYTYLVPFITLYRHYTNAGENERAENINSFIQVIAERSGITGEVDKMIKDCKK